MAVRGRIYAEKRHGYVKDQAKTDAAALYGAAQWDDIPPPERDLFWSAFTQAHSAALANARIQAQKT